MPIESAAIEQTEVWKPAPGFEGYYEVSSLGRIRRDVAANAVTNSVPGRIIKARINQHRRVQATLSVNGKVQTVSVQVLVCEAFHGPRPSGYEVAHWDGDSLNNTSANLRWATPSENEADKHRHGSVARGDRNGQHTKPHRRARGERSKQSHLTGGAVKAIRRVHHMGAATSRELAEISGLSTTAIRNILNEKNWSHTN